MNCFVAPLAIDGFTGVTASDSKLAGPTVRVVLPVTPTQLAPIWDVPCPVPVARPPAGLVATAVFDDAQVDELVTSSNVPSE